LSREEALAAGKALAFERAVSVRLDRPSLPPSPGHGTASAILGRGRGEALKHPARLRPEARLAGP